MQIHAIPDTKSEPRPEAEAPQLAHAERPPRKFELGVLEQRLAPGHAVIGF